MFKQIFGEEGAKRVTKWTVSVLFFLSLFLIVQIFTVLKKLPNIGNEFYPQAVISVSGKSEVYVIPDIATFNFTVTERGGTVKEAQEKADTKINKSLSAVRELGVEDKDIKTTGYNVYPKYEWVQPACVTYPCPAGRNVLTGYEVSQSITVKVRDTEKAGDLVTKVGASGVSNISGLEFTVDNKDELAAKAREEAIAEAKEKAKVLAKQLGVRLGKMMNYYENSNNNYDYDYAYGKGGGVANEAVSKVMAELPAGETKIISDISIIYEVK